MACHREHGYITLSWCFVFLSLDSAASSLPSLEGLDMPSISSKASVSLELKHHVEANDL